MSLFISSGYCFALAVMILLLPPKWIMSAMIAALIHELCHYLAILACSGKTAGVGLYSFSARMALPEMGRGKELLCALAGPFGGLVLWFLAPWFPRLALCAAVQSLYNLMPVYPLDGGRALRCVLHIFLPPSAAEFVEAFLAWLTIGVLLILSLYVLAVLRQGVFLLFATVVLVFRTKDAKMPCKAGHFALQ